LLRIFLGNWMGRWLVPPRADPKRPAPMPGLEKGQSEVLFFGRGPLERPGEGLFATGVGECFFGPAAAHRFKSRPVCEKQEAIPPFELQIGAPPNFRGEFAKTNPICPGESCPMEPPLRRERARQPWQKGLQKKKIFAAGAQLEKTQEGGEKNRGGGQGPPNKPGKGKWDPNIGLMF